METRQFFSRMLIMINILKEFFTSTINGIAGVRYVSSNLVILNFGLNDQLQCRKIIQTKKRRKPKAVTHFLKWSINMIVQSQSRLCTR